jgi:hypothetical protein
MDTLQALWDEAYPVKVGIRIFIDAGKLKHRPYCIEKISTVVDVFAVQLAYEGGGTLGCRSNLFVLVLFPISPNLIKGYNLCKA